MALATDTPRDYAPGISPVLELFLMAASQTLYEGAAVGVPAASGTARVATAGATPDVFAGFAERKAVSAASGSTFVEVRQRGQTTLTVAKATNWAQTDLWATVYASDDGTFTLTSTNNVAIGTVVSIESGIGTTSAVAKVYFEGKGVRSL